MSKGIIFVDSPDDIVVNPKGCLIVCKKFESLVKSFESKNSELYSPYDRSLNKGFFRILLYRESKRTKQILIGIVVSKGYEIEDSFKQALIEELSVPVLDFNVVSLLLI